MFSINISSEIKHHCPNFAGAAIYTKVRNTTYNSSLWDLINKEIVSYRDTHQLEDIKKNPAIAATRKAYKTLGKDPNRYRPSSEALCRRIIRELSLYQIDTLVDLVNLVSIRTGYSIGGFDADKIEGNTLTLGVGKTSEPYEGIGRGLLNIERLPIYRDLIGGIGTPTSDNERTKINIDTTHFLAIINGYSGKDGLQEATEYMQSLLIEFAHAEDIEILYF